MQYGNKLCQWCRKMFPKNNVRFYPKADMMMCCNCVDDWEGKNRRHLTADFNLEKTKAADII